MQQKEPRFSSSAQLVLLKKKSFARNLPLLRPTFGFGVLVTFASSSTATTYIDLGWVTAFVQNDRGWQRALRESWRQKCFNRFRSQDRTDASACRNVPCKASRLKAIQGMTLTSHEYGVLTGGVVRATYPELVAGGLQRLVVLGAEVG